MLFGKLLPREGNFFELFNQHAGYIVEGARAFIAMIENYSNLDQREKYAERPGPDPSGQHAEAGDNHDDPADDVNPSPGREVHIHSQATGGDHEVLVLEQGDESFEEVQAAEQHHDHGGEADPTDPW